MGLELTIPQELISSLGVQQIVDIRSQLPVNPKYTWAQLAGVRSLSALTTIVLHHDAIKKSIREGWSNINTAKNIAQTHINTKNNEPDGDAGFPYHIWIRNGQAYLCNNIEDFTYGVTSNNGYTVHVCVCGEYAYTDALTEADRNMLLAVCIALKSSLPAYQAIKAHGEIKPTDCPGYNYRSIREDVVTIEQKLLQQNTWQAKLTKVGELANQYQYMFDLIKAGENDGNAAWAINSLLDVHAVLKERKLL